MEDVRSRTTFVLCNPADVRNVAGAIRAVVNSGIAEIRVVTEQTFDERDLLCYSSSAIEHAHLTFFEDVPSAIADCDRVIGTSRRLRDADAPPEWPAAGLARRLVGQGRTAVMFGCERTGLTRSELMLCSAVVHLPTSESYPSMNLAHAVACVGYELARPDPLTVGPQNGLEVAPRLTEAARASFFRRIEEICQGMNYPPGRSSNAFVRRLRKILHRANPNQQELSLIGGVFSDWRRLGRTLGVYEEPSGRVAKQPDEDKDGHDDSTDKNLFVD